MKVIKRISLFFVMAGIMFSAGSYATLKAEQFFYPNKYGETGNGAAALYQDGEKTKEQVIETAVEKAPVITADTVYLIEEVNLSDGTIQEKEEDRKSVV